VRQVLRIANPIRPEPAIQQASGGPARLVSSFAIISRDNPPVQALVKMEPCSAGEQALKPALTINGSRPKLANISAPDQDPVLDPVLLVRLGARVSRSRPARLRGPGPSQARAHSFAGARAFVPGSVLQARPGVAIRGSRHAVQQASGVPRPRASSSAPMERVEESVYQARPVPMTGMHARPIPVARMVKHVSTRRN